MLQANMFEAKSNLSKYIAMLESGQEDSVLIARHNKPVAKLVLLDEAPRASRIGIARGALSYSDDWDSNELNEEVAELFGALR